MTVMGYDPDLKLPTPFALCLHGDPPVEVLLVTGGSAVSIAALLGEQAEERSPALAGDTAPKCLLITYRTWEMFDGLLKSAKFLNLGVDSA